MYKIYEKRDGDRLLFLLQKLDDDFCNIVKLNFAFWGATIIFSASVDRREFNLTLLHNISCENYLNGFQK